MILIELFLTFCKIGAFTFGGGYAMIAMIQYSAQEHNWLSQSELIDFVALSESTPGPLAINMATFVGMKTAGIPGAVTATFAVILPSFLIILIIARCFERFRKNKAADGILNGIKPAVVGFIATAFLSTLRAVLFPEGLQAFSLFSADVLVYLFIFLTAAILSFRKKNPISIILISAVLGIFSGYALGL